MAHRKTSPKLPTRKATARRAQDRQYCLRLFITGQTPRSDRSIRNLRSICDEFLSGQFELEVVDIYQQPSLARKEQILAAPTLVKELPPPIQRLVGDLSDRRQVLLRLGIREGEKRDSVRDGKKKG